MDKHPDAPGGADGMSGMRKAARMLRWIIVIELLALVGIGSLVAYRWFAPSGGGSDGPKVPFAVRWTDEALGPITKASIRICKSAHVMTVFDGDRAVKSYRAAVGGGRQDKTREGDRCTPEGRFHVCSRNPRSKYVLSLGLSYPNAEDAARGLRDGLIDQPAHDRIVRAIRSGACPPWDTPLGGEIMIHGCGAGRDWTLGCVALDDDDIRELYPAIPLRTPVTIHP
jgi:hypothetical protein